MDALRQEIRLELEGPLARGTRWGTAIIGVYFLALLPMYFSLGASWKIVTAGWITVAASAVLLGIAFALRRPPTVAGRSELLAALGISAVMVQVLTNLLVRGSWIHTSDLMILVVAMSIIIRRRPFFFALLLLASGAWWTAAGFDHHELQLHHWAIGMISASLVSVVIHLHLRRLWQHQEDLMVQDRQLMEEKARLVTDLETALENVKTLRGLIPICAHCKKVRNDKGYWEQVETYVRLRTEARFSHGICPDCLPGVRAEVERLKADSGPTRNLVRQDKPDR